MVVLAMVCVGASHSLWEQFFERHPDQFFMRITKALHRLLVRVTDPPIGISDKDCVGSDLEEIIQYGASEFGGCVQVANRAVIVQDNDK